MNIKTFFIMVLVAVSVLAAPAFAASTTVTGNGSTFILNKNGGFDGVDGSARESAFVAALQVWADILVSPVYIVVDAEFSSALYCDSYSATLGSAGPQNTYFSSGAETMGLQNNTWYPTALINAHNGSDMFVGSADISAQFNADIGDADCLASSGWYYGMDGNTPTGYIDFYEVVLHELGHGLGILSLVYSDGAYPNTTIDIFSTFLRDQDSATNWTSMSSNATRAASIVDNGNLVWSGPEVTALSGDLTSGVNGGYVQMYAPSVYEGGSSVSHFDTALTPNELMEPEYTGGSGYEHSVALLKDIGWTTYVSGNAVPEITGQASLSVDEDNDLTLSVSHLTIVDSDDSSFTLTVNSGANYSVSGQTISPDANYFGILTVPVTVNDGESDSASFNVSITVNAQNDAPSITSTPAVSFNEDSSHSFVIGDFGVTDVDSASFTLEILSGTNYTELNNSITPDANFNGTLNVNVRVFDGTSYSNSTSFSVSVNAVNDAPYISAFPNLSLNEDENLTLALSDFTIVDIDSSSFTLTVGSGDHYSVIGKTIYPDTDYNGSLSVPVFVSDGIDNSATSTLTVPVNAVNDAPILSATPQTQVTMLDSYQVSFSASDIESSSLSFSVNSLFSWLSIDNSGVLTGTPTGNDIGTESVTVTVSDGDLSDSIQFDLTVSDLAGTDVSVLATIDQALVNVNETAQLTLSVANQGPAIYADGSVQVTIPATLVVDSFASGCQFDGQPTLVRCDFTGLTDSTQFTVDVYGQSNSTNDIAVAVSAVQADPQSDNDDIDVTLIIDNQQLAPIASAQVGSLTNSRAATFADLGGDDVNELILANASNDESFQFNSQFDALTADDVFATVSDGNAVATADFNNDGFTDVVFANSGANTVYLNDQAGGFNPALMLGNAESLAVVAADFNDDSFVDLFFANNGANVLYLNDQAGGFVTTQSLGAANSSAVALIDYNQDGYPDLVVVNLDEDDWIWLNNGADQTTGVFNSSPVLLGNSLRQSTSVAVVDIDNDGDRNDILVGYSTLANEPSVVVYQVSAMALTTLVELDAGDVVSLSAGDFDGNDGVDIAVINSQNIVQLFMQQSSVFSRDYVFESSGAVSVLLQEMNDDSQADLVVVHDDSAATQLYISEGPVVTGVPQVTSITPTTVEPETDASQNTSTDAETTIVVVQSGGSGGTVGLFLLSLLWLLPRKRNKQ